MNKPLLIALYMYPRLSDQKAMAAPLLDSLEAGPDLIPSEWGRGEREKAPYDRKEVLAGCGDPPYFFLYRKSVVKYSGDCDLGAAPYVHFKFDKSTPPRKWPAILALADRVAAAVKARFGLLHIFRFDKVPWTSERERLQRWLALAAQPVPVRFYPNGALALGLRTYFGGDLVEMFGRELLLTTPGVVTKLDWGGIRIDLAEDLWNLDEEAAFDLWSKAMDHLAPSHALARPVFEEDRMTVEFEPSEAWTSR